MKLLIATFLVLSSFAAFSQETIRITAGNSVTIRPQSEVTVVCEGAVTTTNTTRYCQCRPSLFNGALADLIQVIKKGDGTIYTERLLFHGIYFSDCYYAMANNLNCR